MHLYGGVREEAHMPSRIDVPAWSTSLILNPHIGVTITTFMASSMDRSPCLKSGILMTVLIKALVVVAHVELRLVTRC